MTTRPLDEVARALDELANRVEQADAVAREVLAPAVAVLTDPRATNLADELRELAEMEALLALARLLRRPASAGDPAAIEPKIDERKLATSRTGRVLTLGERRALARKPSRAAFDKLLLDPHPMVVANLLANPRLTEDDVVRMVARRPAYPSALAEIAAHPAWSQRPRVRLALVQNPTTPAEIAVPLVSLLIRSELDEIANAPDLPAVLRAAALERLARRPPVPGRRSTPPTQQ
jgi:hypothetical protein